MKNVAFYLKINQDTKSAINYLNYWIETALLHGGDCYVLCDKEELVMKIKENLLLADAVKFIKSDRAGMNAKIMDGGVVKVKNRFFYAGYAHLTTFSHAIECEYDGFWDIDADDTEICLSAERSAELLLCAESYAQENEFDCFSLDMYYSRSKGKHWSFGVTYVKNRRDWLDLMYWHAQDKTYIDWDEGRKINLDWYFTYLKTCQELKIETFYFENLKFIHDVNKSGFADFPSWGMIHWQNGELEMPLMRYAICSKKLKSGVYSLPNEIVKLDIDIRDEEAETTILFRSFFWSDYLKKIDYRYMASRRLEEIKMAVWQERHGVERGSVVAYYGCGQYLDKLISKLSITCPVEYFIDGDKEKQGKLWNGHPIIAPEDMGRHYISYVVIAVTKEDAVKQIKEVLRQNNVKGYCLIDEWNKEWVGNLNYKF